MFNEHRPSPEEMGIKEPESEEKSLIKKLKERLQGGRKPNRDEILLMQNKDLYPGLDWDIKIRPMRPENFKAKGLVKMNEASFDYIRRSLPHPLPTEIEAVSGIPLDSGIVEISVDGKKIKIHTGRNNFGEIVEDPEALSST